MGHDAFAHHGLGSAALMIISALHQRPDQTVGELVGTSSVSRATTYRTLRRLAEHGLVHHTGETWALAPRALEGLGNSLPEADTCPALEPAHGWDTVAEQYGTTGLATQRKALHAAQRAAYREALNRLAEHRSRAVVIVRDGRQVLVPTPRPDEVSSAWHTSYGHVLEAQSDSADDPFAPHPNTQIVLNTRHTSRSQLNYAVPEALQLQHRIRRYNADTGIQHSDIVALAVDAFLRARATHPNSPVQTPKRPDQSARSTLLTG
ncbi:helix-turn-helix domain-containing protein [Streptomyces sp. LN245]|uniref:helix-turn-helix domain-containing protein n=1 Tax=Streptomyces sp. LN245 TaxID=3112975 RepID=UPI0037248C15